PPVAGPQAGEGPLRARRHQVVADPHLVPQELLGHHRADPVHTTVVGRDLAPAGAEEAGHGCGAALLELATEHVAHGADHLSTMRPRDTPGLPARAGQQVASRAGTSRSPKFHRGTSAEMSRPVAPTTI